MAWACGNCGAQASRGSVTFDHKGRTVRERCQHCAPEEFDSAFRNPTDNRIYPGPQAMPHLYKRDKNDVYQAKDELLADTAAAWEKGPTERAVQAKRDTRRTEPLTPEEIEKTRHWAEQVLKPALQKGGMGAAVAALNPE